MDAARLAWQCRRGMLELDLLLQAFLDRDYAHATPEIQQDFVALLHHADDMLYAYLMGHMVPFEPRTAAIVARIRRTVAAGETTPV